MPATICRMLAGDDLAHPFLDLGQISGRKGARPALLVRAKIEVVVEARVDRRPDGDLRVGIDAQHGLRHDVRGGVAQPMQELVCFFGIIFLGHDGLLF